MGVGRHPRNVEQHNEEKDHSAQERFGQLRVFLDHDAKGCGDQSHANEIDQKNMRWYPGGHASGHQLGEGEVFPCENGQGDGVEEAAKRHKLIEAARLWHFVLEDEGEADGEDSQSVEVWPENGCGD